MKAHQFDVQGLSNTVWSFAKVLYNDEATLQTIAAAAVTKAAELTSQEMGNTSWAFARLSIYDEQLVDAIAAQGVLRISASFRTQRLGTQL